MGERWERTYRVVVMSSLGQSWLVDGLTSEFKYCLRGSLTDVAPLGFCRVGGQ